LRIPYIELFENHIPIEICTILTKKSLISIQ
jgi:hypothetical protein